MFGLSTKSCSVLIFMAQRQERCQRQYVSCTTLSVMKSGAALATDVHLAAKKTECSLRERRTVNRAAGPRERARPDGDVVSTLTQSFLTQTKTGNDVRLSMAQWSGLSLI